jgi:type II secretory pathway component HofQ
VTFYPPETGEVRLAAHNYPDEEISTILHDVANRFDLDLVLPTSVNGRATVKLKHVTWRQIFSATLPPYYTFVLEGNVVRVSRLQSPERTPGCQGGYLIPIKSPTR